MTLSSWIEKTGPKKIAKALAVEPSTVSCWKTRTKLPRPEHMFKIFRLSNGRVTYKDMIENFVKQ